MLTFSRHLLNTTTYTVPRTVFQEHSYCGVKRNEGVGHASNLHEDISGLEIISQLHFEQEREAGCRRDPVWKRRQGREHAIHNYCGVTFR